jgi:hypothetical protein
MVTRCADRRRPEDRHAGEARDVGKQDRDGLACAFDGSILVAACDDDGGCRCRVVVLSVGGIAMAKRRSTAFTELGTRAVWSPARDTAQVERCSTRVTETRIITHALPGRTTGHLRIIEVAFVPSIQTPLVRIAIASTSRTSVRRSNGNRKTSVATGATWQRSSSSHRTMACSPVCR